MLKQVGFAGIAISSAMALVMIAGVDAAAAKTKKLSYESAFAKCKQEIGATSRGRQLPGAVFRGRGLHEEVRVSAQEVERREAESFANPVPLSPH